MLLHLSNPTFYRCWKLRPLPPEVMTSSRWKTTFGFPANWMILSSFMLSALAVQLSPLQPLPSAWCSLPTTTRPCRRFRPRKPPFRILDPHEYHEFVFATGGSVLYSDDDPYPPSPIPASLLHLSGFAQEFDVELRQQAMAIAACDSANLRTEFDPQDSSVSGEMSSSQGKFFLDPGELSSNQGELPCHEQSYCTSIPATVPPAPGEPFSVPIASKEGEIIPSIKFRSSFSATRTDYSCAPQAYHASTAPFDPHFVSCLRSGRTETVDFFPIILDTGCSFAMTFDVNDFEGTPVESDWGSVQTASTALPMTAFGMLKWNVMMDDGQMYHLRTPGFLVPDSNMRLLSPQDYARYHKLPTDTDQFGGNSSRIWMSLHQSKARWQCNVDPRSNLPIGLGCIPQDVNTSCGCHSCFSCFQANADNVLQSSNQNLTQVEKEILLDHQRLGHINMDYLQALYRPRQDEDQPSNVDHDVAAQDCTPCIVRKSKAMSSCTPPKCLACALAKAKRRPTGASHKKDDAEKGGILRDSDLLPADKVSMDHYESSVRGRLPDKRGRERDHQRYCGGTIFVDHASSAVYVYHQVSLGAAETLKSKRAFEQELLRCGVTVKEYHTDNGHFTAKSFAEHIEAEDQRIEFSGVGAQHQNAQAERRIQTTSWMARTMMIHCSIMWPDEFSGNLWPFALSYAAWMYNHPPRRDLPYSPQELLCGVKTGCRQLRRARVWGGPAYVLDPKLQDGKKLPKWKPRARRGQFLGFSAQHSTTVGVIRNLITDYCSPQFHVVFDESFNTIASTQDTADVSTWENLFRTSREVYLDGYDESRDGPLPARAPEWLPESELSAQQPEPTDTPTTQQQPTDRLNNTNNPQQAREDPNTDPPAEDERSVSSPVVIDSADDQSVDRPTATDDGDSDDARSTPLRRSTRTRKPNSKYIGDEWVNTNTSDMPWRNLFKHRAFEAVLVPQTASSFLFHSLDWSVHSSDPIDARFHALLMNSTDPYTNEIMDIHPLAFGVKVSNADTPTIREVLQSTGKEREEWFHSMNVEIDALQEKGTFELVDRSVAGTEEIVGTQCVFKRKRRPDGSFLKFKSRLVVRGDQEKSSVTKNETYAPVVDWATVRLLFNLAIALNLETALIDFRNAFVQSDFPAPIYCELPPTYGKNPGLKGKIMKVKKSLYGDCRAPQLWYNYLSEKLISLGFIRSDHDQCLFLRKDCIIAAYVDDACIVCKDRNAVDALLSELRDLELDFDEEGSIKSYLGVQLETINESTMKFSQPGLTDRLLEVLGLTDSKPAPTPATAHVGRSADEPPHTGPINYRSAVGMAMYLGTNTRLDCAFAIHQCARFSHDPRAPHLAALKRLGRYLTGTRTEGLLFTPTKDLRLDCYVDADFAGLFGAEDPQDPSCARSRTGYIVTLGGIPMLWASRLQSQISTSTCEAEYVAASQAMRALVHLRAVLAEIAATLDLPYDPTSYISTVHEDNQCAKTLAESDPPRLTPRTKHIAIRYHWFKSHLAKPGTPGGILFKYIESKLQLADILTKPLTKAEFERARLQTMGW